MNLRRTFQAICILLPLWTVSAVKAAPAQPRVELYTIDCGLFLMTDADVYSDEGRFKGSSRVMVNPCYLIRHGSDYMMWDLGMPDSLALKHQRLTSGVLTLSMPKTLASQLTELPLDPKKVKYISISHQDGDHIGNAGLFQNAEFLVDERERAQMFGDWGLKAAAQSWDGFAIAPLMELKRRKTVEIAHTQPYDVFGDGTVVIYPAPGHTPGHRVLLVRLPQAGPVLLTGDLWHLRESREWRTVPRITQYVPTPPEVRAQLLATMDAVEKLASDTGARVIRQHVPEDFFSMPAFPDSLH